MVRWLVRVGALVGLLLAQAMPTTSADPTLIAAGSFWRYNATGSNLGTAWRATAYNDGSWPSGAAQLGYGDGDEATVVPYGGNANNRYVTYYFRQSFMVTDPASVAALTIRFVRDDGCVIYLNGVEVVRSNLPSGTISYTTLASAAIGGTDESAWQEAPIDPALLVAGSNVVAVELHQSGITSSDISFDLELRATSAQTQSPTVSLVSPPNQSVSNMTAVSFSASASAAAGLASATLYVGGPPQTVSFSGTAKVEDTQITADQPTVNNGGALSLNVDGQTPHAHGLIKFPTLIGSSSAQVPAGALITSATLRLNCTNAGHMMRLYRLTEDWVEGQATWNQRSSSSAWSSPGADGAASNTGVALNGDCTATGQRQIDITPFVQEWSNGSPNYGIVLVESGTDGIDFGSSESASSPELSVVYKGSQQAVETLMLSGTSAPVSFSVALALGQTYYWNILVADVNGQQGWAASDYSLTLDASAPDEPLLISPDNGSTEETISPTLSALVGDPAGGSLDVTFSQRTAAAEEFTIIALPDTQHYSEAFPAIYTAQTQWIVNNKAARNIVFVMHLGDIVEHANLIPEWEAANTAMLILDNNAIPYGLLPGNHDQPTTNYNQYFPYTRYLGKPWYGGHYADKNDNNFQLFSAGGIDFLMVNLEFCPPAAVVSWADSVLKSYPGRTAMFATHGYLGETGARSVGGCSNTQYLWDGLAVPNPNLHFMFCGHVHTEQRRTDMANGHPVFQMLSDYQDRASGGEGWLRIVRFVPAENKIYVQTYSPWLNRFETDADSEFTLDFPMGGTFSTIGSVTVSSGSAASYDWSGLSAATQYEWRVEVTNSSGKSRLGPTWSFTTAGAPQVNQPPVAAGQAVSASEDTATAIVLGATDPDSDPLSYIVLSGPSHGTLSGSAPNLSYQPAANYSGADSFTFSASDGELDSNAATVSITVQAVNDPPSATGEAYSLQAGGTLTVNAPGVLANDSDIDSATLTAVLVSGAAQGSLSLNANGSFSYTPASGFSGSDSFTYRASDGQATSSIATVSLTISPAAPGPGPIFTANFNAGLESFAYLDNTFRGTNQGTYASGSRIASGGFTGGALRVLLGGVNNNTITGMSGGWRRTFILSAPASLLLSFRYNLTQTAEYESDEFSQALASVNGVLYGTPPNDYAAQIAGNGNGGAAITTGWQLFQIPLGTLPAGTHTLILGGYNNHKTTSTESTTIVLDDVSVTVAP